MSLHLYNTLSRSLEPFKPRKPDEVKVYYCGPTPYNYAHIGNLRNYLADDFIVKTLRFLGYNVKTTMNITDIDDKTIRDSQKSGKSLGDFTRYYTEEFLNDLEKLSIEKADNIKPISELIDDMGEIIDGLIQKGYAYLADDGSIYYSVRKFEKYGNLAHLDVSGMISSVRIDNDEYEKEQVADFALWKAYDPEVDGDNWWEIEVTTPSLQRGMSEGQGDFATETTEKNPQSRVTRDSSFTKELQKIKGRPGWHIECSACNKHFFGDQIDIHMGGIDLVFPHHQNEIAQTEAYTGKEFSKYWLHGGHLLVDNKKMAKSAGNFYTLRDIVERMKTPPLLGEAGRGTSPNPSYQDGQEVLIYRGFRLMGLQNQYRESFNFTFDRLSAAINTIKGLDEMMKRLGRYQSSLRKELDSRSEDGGLDISERNARGKLKFPEIQRAFRDNSQALTQAFVEKLENDFDTNSAMTVVFELQTYINSGIDEKNFSFEESKSLVSLLENFDQVISILDFSLLESDTEIPEDIQKLALDRYDAKLAKNWSEADKIRDKLADMGWKMIDEKDGWRVEKI